MFAHLAGAGGAIQASLGGALRARCALPLAMNHCGQYPDMGSPGSGQMG